MQTAIVTGANTGLGFETAIAIYRMGMRVIVACRSEAKGRAAMDRIRAGGAGGELVFEQVNLSSLESVREFAERINNGHDRLDLLVNNAGVMVPPPSLTEDGYELQFGVNFVAHFALTGRLFGLLEATPGARVITLSSIGHRGAAIDFDNFTLQKPYDKWREYGQSKLADLILALEFHRRLLARGCQLASLAAHPGISQSELTRSIDPAELPGDIEFIPTVEGAAPTIAAATWPDATSGQYYGPDGPREVSGKPALAEIDPAALNSVLNARLWDWAEQATGIAYP